MEFEIKSFSLKSVAIPVKKQKKDGSFGKKIIGSIIGVDIIMSLMPIIKPNTFAYTDRGVIYRFEFGDFQVYQISAIDGREVWSFRSVKYMRYDSVFNIKLGSTVEGSQLYMPIGEGSIANNVTLSMGNANFIYKNKI